MTIYNQQWKPRAGQHSTEERNRLRKLVRAGKASFIEMKYRMSPDEALKAAGLV